LSEPPPEPPRRGDFHASTLALRKRIASAHAFRDHNVAVLAAIGLSVLAVLALAPLARHSLADVTERLTTIGALMFLISAPGYWLGIGHRSLAIAGAIVLALYASTAWIGSGGRVDDLFVLARVLAFLIFALAGFNLVFVFEEIIYDAHRLLPHRRRGWLALPFVLDLALCGFLPWWSRHGGLQLPTFWFAALATTIVLGSWWFIRLTNQLDRRQLVIREMHLFVAGILAAALLADAVQYLVSAEAFISSLLAYVALLATWVYVSYTTLQRTHLLLRGRNAAPWAAILLAATYAIVAHGQGLFLQSGTGAVQERFSPRMAMGLVGQLRTITPRSRAVADQTARVAKGMLKTEHVVEKATRSLYLGLDRALPGTPKGKEAGPLPRGGWIVDEEGHMTAMHRDLLDSEE